MWKIRTVKGNNGFTREMSAGAIRQTIPEEVTLMLRPKKQVSHQSPGRPELQTEGTASAKVLR